MDRESGDDGSEGKETRTKHDVDQDADVGDSDGGNGEKKAIPKARKSSREGRTTLEIADNLIINDLVEDNRLSEGEIEVILRVRNSGRNGNWWKWMGDSARWVSCIWYFPRLLFSICLSRKPHFCSPSSQFHLEPYDAEDIYMRWACVLVAQAFPKWLDDMQKSGMSNMSSKDGLSEQVARFRRGLLCSAALHTQRCAPRSFPEEDQGHVSGVRGHSHLDFNVWRQYLKLCNGIFSLQELLRVACESGAGLPFGERHVKGRAGGEDSEFSYSKFQSKLYRIREMFLVDDVEILEQFGTHHLEWLAVFLSVPDWRKSDQEGACLKPSPFNSTRIAMDNLRFQLGLPTSGSQSRPFFSESLTGFPLFKMALHRNIWGNRNLSEASLHADNMFALSAGYQFKFMTKMKALTSDRISKALSSLGISHLTDLYSSSETSSTLTDMVEANSSFETGKEIGLAEANTAEEDACLSANVEHFRLATTTDH